MPLAVLHWTDSTFTTNRRTEVDSNRTFDQAGAAVQFRPSTQAATTSSGTWSVVCRAPDGSIKWQESTHNLVVNEGLNHELAVMFKGTAPGTFAIGLKGTGAVAAGDTHAAHAGWAELTAYTEANRPTWTTGAVGSQSLSNSASPARFTANGAMTVAGIFLANNATKGSVAATSILYAAGDFAAARTLASGDTLDASYTVSKTAV